MIVRTRFQRHAATLLTLACVLALVLAGTLWWLGLASTGMPVTAYFAKAVGVYAGSEVKVLGVGVGKITSVVPRGDRVQVDMRIDDGVQIPANASAVVVAPSLVSDRYVQLAPAYDGGPLMRAGTKIPLSRTQTPVELDDLTKSVNELSTALGPNGANSNGALSDVLDTAAANLSGNGELFGRTLRELSDATATLSDSRGDLFDTVDNLQRFTKALADSDAQVRSFNDRLASVTGYLSQDRDELGVALGSLGQALTDVHGFIGQNSARISSNVHKLTGVTQALVDQRASVAEILDVAPLAMTNFLSTYDAASASFAIRGNLNELTYPPVLMLCRTIDASTPKKVPKTVSDLCKKLSPYLDGTLKLPSAAQALAAVEQGKLPPLPIPLVGLTGPLPGGGA